MPPSPLRRVPHKASFADMKQPLPLCFALCSLVSLAACSQPAPPTDNAAMAAVGDGTPLVTRSVRIGSEGPTIAACPSISRVKDGGTQVYWAPGETRALKAKLAGAAQVALCEATADDAWFGVVFAAPGGDMDNCGISRAVADAREYQGPCRWGWIKGGTVRLGA